MRSSLVGAFVVAWSCVAAPALAQRDPVLAEALFRQGRRAVETGDLKTACAKFGESYRLDPAPGTLLNLADCEERSGRLASAWEHFNQLNDTLAPGDDRRALAHRRAEAVAARAPQLRVDLDPAAPSDARVLRDGKPVDPAAIGVSVPIDPGEHELVLRAPNRHDSITKVKLGVGERRAVTLRAGALLPASATAPPPTSVRHGLGGGRVFALVVVGAGVAAAGTGGAFGGLALASQSKASTYCTGAVCGDPQGVKLHDTARTDALVADVLFGSAVALAATGLVIWLASKPSHAEARAYLAPLPGGLTLGGAF